MAQESESAEPILHRHKHRIKTPLMVFIAVLLIILLVGAGLFYIQNKSFLQQKIIETKEQTFQVDHLLLKVLLKEKESSEQEIRILNTDQKEQEFLVSVEGVQDIISLDQQSFSLQAQQTKIITAQFSAIDSAKGTEHQPGVYAGMFIVESKTKQEIPLIVEIESSQVLFDTNLNPVSLESKVNRGEDFIVEVRLFNLQTVDAKNVDMRYAVKDMRSNTLLTEQETAVVKTQASFFKTISIPPSIAPGTYVFIAESRVGDSVGTSSYLFEVVDQNIEQSSTLRSFCSNDPFCQGLSVAMLVLLLAIAAYFYLFVGAYFYQKMSNVISPQSVLKKQQREKSRLKEFMEEWRKNAQMREIRKAKEQERIAKMDASSKEQHEAERAKERLEQEKLRITKRKQRFEFLKLVLFGKKQEGIIKAITKSKSIFGINNLIEKGFSELKQSKLKQARSTYERTIKKYSTLSIEEKKGVYSSVTSFYNKLIEAENKHHKHEKLQQEKPLLVQWGFMKSIEEKDREQKAKDSKEANQRKIDEANRKKQQAEEANQKELLEIEQKKQQKIEEQQERLRLQDQKKQEAEQKQQQLILQKQQQKEEQEREKQETEQKKQEEERRKLITKEQKKHEEKAAEEEKQREQLIKARETQSKQRQSELKETEKQITSLEQESIGIAQQKEKLVQSMHAIIESIQYAKGKKYAESIKKYQHLEENIRKLEQKQAAVENSLLKARKELLKLEGGAVNTLKLLFLPTAYRLTPQTLPQIPQKQPKVHKVSESDSEETPNSIQENGNSHPQENSAEKPSFVEGLSKEELAKKSPTFRKLKHALIETETALNNKDKQKAKTSYLKARELYLQLEYAEKTEAYAELNTAYSYLSK